jgi:hypothetical protein
MQRVGLPGQRASPPLHETTAQRKSEAWPARNLRDWPPHRVRRIAPGLRRLAQRVRGIVDPRVLRRLRPRHVAQRVVVPPMVHRRTDPNARPQLPVVLQLRRHQTAAVVLVLALEATRRQRGLRPLHQSIRRVRDRRVLPGTRHVHGHHPVHRVEVRSRRLPLRRRGAIARRSRHPTPRQRMRAVAHRVVPVDRRPGLETDLLNPLPLAQVSISAFCLVWNGIGILRLRTSY